MRGCHAGSFEAAHRLRDGAPFDFSQAAIEEHYDLVVVGAGISGLAAAYFYRQRRPNSRIFNSDSGWDACTHVAIDQAHRAVMELTA